jgi:hypothetical protein
MKFKMLICRRFKLIIVYIFCLNSVIFGQELSDIIIPFGDIVMTPMMSYNIGKNASNIPTNFLVANGVKANLGFELGLLFPVYTPQEGDARGFLAVGVSRHLLGFSYGGKLINLGEQNISNHTHSRFFFGLKFIPFDKFKFLTLSATAGYGNINANYASKNINGKIKANATDVSISFSVDLNKFVLKSL